VARNTHKSTRLEVFSGKKAGLNRVILQVLERTSPLIGYDIWRKIKLIKGFMHVDSKTAYRRMEALDDGGYIASNGTRVGKKGGDKTLYELTLKGKAALRWDRKSMENFLRTATKEQLAKFIDAYY
jgi:DNA-binding PadR family transcriptional regulator